jgi:hypothetical protein
MPQACASSKLFNHSLGETGRQKLPVILHLMKGQGIRLAMKHAHRAYMKTRLAGRVMKIVPLAQ